MCIPVTSQRYNIPPVIPAKSGSNIIIFCYSPGVNWLNAASCFVSVATWPLNVYNNLVLRFPLFLVGLVITRTLHSSNKTTEK